MSAPDPQSPETTWRREFPGAIDEVGRALSWVEAIAKRLSLPDEQRYALLLCVEELVSNVVRHNGAPDAAAPLRVAIGLEARPGRVVLTIEDNGFEFDVVNAPEKEIATSIDGLAPGGLGIALVKRFASRLRYARRAHLNRVVAEFDDPPATEARRE